VIRTKQHKERIVRLRLSLFVDEVYLPLLKTKRPGQLIGQVEPLFPSYLFARFRLGEQSYRLSHTSGVRAIVSAGDEPCELDLDIIDRIRNHETDGVIVPDPRTCHLHQHRMIVEGSFRSMDTLFHRYLSSTERVAVLMDSIGAVI
jgi:transcriptional antiterminator RfaH